MLNSVNPNATSFGAKFQYDGCNYGHDRVFENIKKDPETAGKIAEFLEFIQSDDGKNLLRQLPEEDTLELSAPIRYIDSGRGEKISPTLEYSSQITDKLSDEETLSLDVDKFKEWAENKINDNHLQKWARAILSKVNINPHKEE